MPTRPWTPAQDLPGYLGEFHGHYDGVDVGAPGAAAAWVARGGSLTAVQNTPGSRPVRVADALAGKSVFDFDGVDDTFALSGLGGVVPRFVASVALLKSTADVARNNIVTAWNGADVGRWIHDAGSPTQGMRHLIAASTTTTHTALAGAATSTTSYWIREGALDGLVVRALLNGVFGGTASTMAAAPGTTATAVIIGGRASGNAAASPIRLAHLVFGSLYPSSANRERLEGYLAHEWGLTALLAAGHPHKAAPPTVETGGTVVLIEPAGLIMAPELGRGAVMARTLILPAGMTLTPVLDRPGVIARAALAPAGLAVPAALDRAGVVARASLAPAPLAIPPALRQPAVVARTMLGPAGLAVRPALGRPGIVARTTVAPMGLRAPVALGRPSIVVRAVLALAGLGVGLVLGRGNVVARAVLAPLGLALGVALGRADLETAADKASPVRTGAGVLLNRTGTGALLDRTGEGRLRDRTGEGVMA